MSVFVTFFPRTAGRICRSSCLAGLVWPACAAQAQAPDPVVAKVNGVEIRQSDLAIAEEDIGGSLPPNITGDAKREYLITYLTDMILIAQDAEVQGMSATDEFKRRFQMMRSKVLMELLLRQIGAEGRHRRGDAQGL